MSNPYLELTEEFNRGRLRVLLSSGQAVVVHRLAIMSKDGDWILREDAEALAHVLEVLSLHEARYRFGAPLDLRWLTNGWSSHFEFRRGPLRLRTDFVTRPPRITAEWLARIWGEAESTGNEVIGLEPLAALKLTNRDKDYAVVGELARHRFSAALLRGERSWKRPSIASAACSCAPTRSVWPGTRLPPSPGQRSGRTFGGRPRACRCWTPTVW